MKKQEQELQESEGKRMNQERRLKIKEKTMSTMVRERLELSDAMFNSIKHISGVGKCSDYNKESLVALVKQIALEQPSFDRPRKDEPKVILAISY